MTKLETEFTRTLLLQLEEAERITGAAELRLAAQVQKEGGVKAVKGLIARRQMTRQFMPLKEKGRLDLSPEALVVKGKFASLFSDEEADACLQALLDAGMF